MSDSPRSRHLGFELAARPLAAGGLVERAADDVRAHGESCRRGASRRRETLRVPSSGRTSPPGRSAPGRRPAAGRRAPASGSAGPSGREGLRDRPRCRCGRAAPPARTRPLASDSTLSELATIASARRASRRSRRIDRRPAAHVVVQVPDETHRRRLDQRRGDVRLEAVGVHDGRAGASRRTARSASQVSGQRHGRCERLPCEAQRDHGRSAAPSIAPLSPSGASAAGNGSSTTSKPQIAAALGQRPGPGVTTVMRQDGSSAARPSAASAGWSPLRRTPPRWSDTPGWRSSRSWRLGAEHHVREVPNAAGRIGQPGGAAPRRHRPWPCAAARRQSAPAARRRRPPCPRARFQSPHDSSSSSAAPPPAGHHAGQTRRAWPRRSPCRTARPCRLGWQ